MTVPCFEIYEVIGPAIATAIFDALDFIDVWLIQFIHTNNVSAQMIIEIDQRGHHVNRVSVYLMNKGFRCKCT
ncbi:hypothetical protein PCS_01849 [Desulfocurvibacter africanus PCS]|uniref:Uncharacterized protein n=1 Tax=Desulfocurvibacter africanus PCS TaxID=1262666 RepID=M5PSI5_DESAF|nr:hypothetical protein PCS_01849 [Desulfocurvibacter africanus PCS]